MVELDYSKLKNEIIEHLKDNNEIVLSTCSNNKVTSRNMSYVSDEIVMYFLTSSRSNKIKQIIGNNIVSLCVGNIQIEGIAEIIGSPLNDNNTDVSKLYKSKHEIFFKRFAHFKVATFIKVNSCFIKLWVKEGKRDFFYCLDVVKKKAYKRS